MVRLGSVEAIHVLSIEVTKDIEKEFGTLARRCFSYADAKAVSGIVP